MANNITEVLYEIQKLTRDNLKILDAINESFYSTRENVSTIIDGTKYTIPSFIYLESKLNVLEENFKNLISAPQTGEAAFVFDGNTQSIAMQRFTTTPAPLKLKDPKSFQVKENEIFKDFITPNAFVRFNVDEIPNDINEVVVKKVTFTNPALIEFVKENFGNDKTYQNIIKMTYNYVSGSDYSDYDTIVRLPSHKKQAWGRYTINKVISQNIDSNFIQHYALRLNDDLDYLTENGTIERGLKVGDILLCNNDTVKLSIDKINYSEREITITVLNNAYANLTMYTDETHDDTGVLNYFSDIVSDDRYVDVTLEEDELTAVFIAPLNKLNSQATFGEGVMIDSNEIYFDINGDGKITTVSYKEYYDLYVNNIGDTLLNLTKMFRSDMFQMTESEIGTLIGTPPSANDIHVDVVQINKHLSNTSTIKSIRRLYAEKQEYKSQIESKQSEVNNLREQLKTSAFNDTISGRMSAQSRLDKAESEVSKLNSNLVKTINAITNEVNNSVVPVEDAKYRIRGYFNVKNIETAVGNHKVVKIDIEYRYKSPSQKEGTVQTFGDVKFAFSEWNRMQSPVVYKIPKLGEDGLEITYPDNTDLNIDAISFNQIDIPISQGEEVEMRVRVQYEDGFPFVETKSAFSKPITVAFPEEFNIDIPITTIIEENNDDADEYRFTAILNENNIITHVDDGINDQGKIYFHKCENINSGFYTNERRDIPLSEKLRSMDASINTLESEVFGTSSDDIRVTLSDGKRNVTLSTNQTITLFVPGYTSNTENRDNAYIAESVYNPGGAQTRAAVDTGTDVNTGQTGGEGVIEVSNTNAISNLILKITNISNSNINLYSMFPGPVDRNLIRETQARFNPSLYVRGNPSVNSLVTGNSPILSADEDDEPLNGVWMYSESTDAFTGNDDEAANLCLQHLNQYVYFRMTDLYDGRKYYANEGENIYGINNQLSYDRRYVRKPADNESIGASLLPIIPSLSSICIPNGNRYILKPGESVEIGLEFKYFLANTASNSNPSIEKTMCVDIRPSLFADPLSYTFKVKAYYYDALLPKATIEVNQSSITTKPNLMS